MTTSAIPDHDPAAPLWTTEDLARFLGYSERQIPRLREEGLPAFRVGGLVRFVPARVMRGWIRGMIVPANWPTPTNPTWVEGDKEHAG